MLLLSETPESRAADIKDALHSFRVYLKEKQVREALLSAERLKVKGYKVQFWQGKEWAVAATTLSPQELFVTPIPTPKTKAEYIVLKALGQVRSAMPKPSTVEDQRCFYNEGTRYYCQQVGKVVAKMWRILSYIQTHKGDL
jgi:hypothetical protein